MYRYYNTKTVKIGKKHYCAYCCKEAIHDYTIGEWHDNEPDMHYYHCDCEYAKMERNIQLKYKALENETQKDSWLLDMKVNENEVNIERLEIEYEIEQLKAELDRLEGVKK